MTVAHRPCVLVFAGLDPSGGAGIVADVQAVAAQGAHALTVATALTVQDNDRVYGVQPVEPDLLLRQAQALVDKMMISAVKIGITGSAANALAIAQVIARLRERQPDLPVVLDPVLASGHGDLLSRDDAAQSLAPLLPLTTVLTPNGHEARALADTVRYRPQTDSQPGMQSGSRAEPQFGAGLGAPDVLPGAQPGLRVDQLGQALRVRGCRHVLITGGHDDGAEVINRWFGPGAGPSFADPTLPGQRTWRWTRLDGAFHGSGCTLASAIAAQLALGMPIAVALAQAQHYVYVALRDAYTVAPGQRIPLR